MKHPQPDSLLHRPKNLASTKNQPKKKLTQATLEQKLTVLTWHHTHGAKQNKTLAHFADPDFALGELHIPQSTLSNWLKDEDNIRAKALASSDPTAKRIRSTAHPDVEAALRFWTLQAIGRGMTINGDTLRTKARDFADSFGIKGDDFLGFSNGWLDGFKRR